MPIEVTPATIATSSTCPHCGAKSSIQTSYKGRTKKIKRQKCLSCEWSYEAPKDE